MDNLITIIREWHPLGQFVFLLVISLFLTAITLTLLNIIEGLVNHTIPVLLRGWPVQVEVSDEELEDDKS